MKSSNRISALLWADILVAFALFVMQDYLTQVWKLNFTHAAAILNIWNGISMVLQPFFVFLVDAFLGNFVMLVISSSAYSLGIGLVTMSTPPVLGTCKQYVPECIGHTQKLLFYIGMALIAIGVAGNNVSIKPFLEEQQEKDGPNIWFKILGAVLVVVVALTGAIALPYINPWTLRFGIPAICTVVATILFLTGLCFFNYDMTGPEGIRVTNVCRVRMLAMLTTFIFCGIVSSVGNTYFVEQAKNLNRNIGKWKLPPQVLLLAQKGAGNLVGVFLNSLDKQGTEPGSGIEPVRGTEPGRGIEPGKGIATAIVFSILCCITAARMELKRLKIVGSHGLVEKEDEGIPMSIYWLIFQFVLLACLDKFLEKSVSKFNEIEFPDESMERRYQDNLAKGVSGVGFMCGVLSVYVVGGVSERGGRKNWFQDTLNESRLDRYYWVLAALGSANLFVFVALCCRQWRGHLEAKVGSSPPH